MFQKHASSLSHKGGPSYEGEDTCYRNIMDFLLKWRAIIEALVWAITTIFTSLFVSPYACIFTSTFPIPSTHATFYIFINALRRCTCEYLKLTYKLVFYFLAFVYNFFKVFFFWFLIMINKLVCWNGSIYASRTITQRESLKEPHLWNGLGLGVDKG